MIDYWSQLTPSEKMSERKRYNYIRSIITSSSHFSGDYNDLRNKPTIPSLLRDLGDDETHRLVTDAEKLLWATQSDWAESDETSPSYIENKPYVPIHLSDLAQDETHRLVTDSQINSWNSVANIKQADWNETDSTDLGFIKNKPDIPTTLGDLSGDTDHRVLSDAQITAFGTAPNWNETDSSAAGYIQNKPTKLSQLNDDSTHRLVTDTEKSEWNSRVDWNQTNSTAIDYIKNKPTIPSSLSSLSTDSTHRTVTDTEKTTWNNGVGTESNKYYSITNFNIRLWRQGKIVVGFWNSSGSTRNSTGTTTLGTLPSSFKPAYQQNYTIQNNDHTTARNLIINTNGTMQVAEYYPNDGNKNGTCACVCWFTA